MSTYRVARQRIIALALCACVPGAYADGLRVAGTRALLQPPPGFVVAGGFPGFEDVSAHASIMVTQLATGVGTIIAGMTPVALAGRGVTLVSAQDVRARGGDARLLRVRQDQAGVAYDKWMLIAGDAKVTLITVATFPAGSPMDLSERLRTALLSTSWDPAGAGDPLAGIGFRIDAGSGLRIAGQVANLLLLNESGTMPAAGERPGRLSPVYIAGHEFSQAPDADPVGFARRVAQSTATLDGVGNFIESATTLDGAPAREVLATAADAVSGEAVSLYQVTQSDGAGYFVVKGMVASTRFAELLPEFRRLTRSIRRSTPTP